MPSGQPSWVAPQPALPTGETRSLDVTRGELAGPRWRSPHRGVQALAGCDHDHPLQRIYDAAELLPDEAAIGGWAAAYMSGATDLDGKGWSGRDREDLPLVLPPRLHLARRKHIKHWRSPLAAEDTVVLQGVRVTSPTRTAFDLARRSVDLEHAVVAIDAMARQAGMSPPAVEAYAKTHPRWRGLPLLRRAVALANPRSRSCGESRLRVLWVVDAGLGTPECNPHVVDADGVVVGMPDLLLAEVGLVGEYDGSQHRDLGNHTRDNAREEGFEGLGLVVVRATSLDVGPLRAATVARLVAGYRRAQRVDPDLCSWGWRPGPLPWMR